MVAIDTSRSPAPHIAGRFISSLFEMANAISTWRNAKITRDVLSKLSNRELDDIDLTRADIDAIAYRIGR